MNNQENEKNKLWKVGQWVGILLIVFLAVVSIKNLKNLDESPMFNTISVNGKGEAISIPDIATFSFTVSENAKTVQDAQDKATAKINSALKAVKDGGVAEKDIKTLSYNISPHYEYNQIVCITYPCPSGKSVLTGYDVSQTVEVKIRNLEKAGELFTAVGTVGIQNVNGLSFSIDDIDSVKALARTEAIIDAKQKAEKIAKDLGVRLVKITSFYDSSDDPGCCFYGRGEGMGGDVATLKAAVAPDVPKGEQKVTVNVTISYEVR